MYPTVMAKPNYLKGVFAKNERVYVEENSVVITTNLTSICCVYKEKMVKDDSYGRT